MATKYKKTQGDRHQNISKISSKRRFYFCSFGSSSFSKLSIICTFIVKKKNAGDTQKSRIMYVQHGLLLLPSGLCPKALQPLCQTNLSETAPPPKDHFLSSNTACFVSLFFLKHQTCTYLPICLPIPPSCPALQKGISTKTGFV